VSQLAENGDGEACGGRERRAAMARGDVIFLTLQN